MNIVLVTRKGEVPPCLETLKRSRKARVDVRDLSAVDWHSLPEDAYIYLALGGVPESDHKSLVDRLIRLFSGRFALVDSKGTIEDPVMLLHRGAKDYIGRGLVEKRLPTHRFLDLLTPLEVKQLPPEEAPGLTQYKPSGSDWSAVVGGTEHTFGILFAHLDESTIRRESLSSQELEKTNRLFRQLVEEHVEPFKGRRWIWRDSGGLVLFPFDGTTSSGIIPALRMHLNRTLIAVEEFFTHKEISYRLVHHIGTTEYRQRGRTSDVISDAVNAIFHIGDRFAPAAGLVATDTSLHFAPAKLRKLFREGDIFEGHRLYLPLL